MKKIVVGLACAGLVLSAGAFANDLDVGVVNVKKVFQKAPQGEATLEKMKDSLKPQVKTLKARQEKLAKQVKALERNAPTMSKSAKKAQEKTLLSQQEGFQKDVLKLRQSELKKEQAAARTFQGDLKKSIAKVGKADDYDMILLQRAVPYYKNTYNVTNQVIANMKKMS